MIEFALGGAEFVIREELVKERADRVLDLMPDIVFLVAHRVADWDLALELAERTADLIGRDDEV
jgi:hypothetical protein